MSQTVTQPFEPDGVYAGILYRVLPDCSIEAMLPGGLVKFKNLDQLLASDVSASSVSTGSRSYDLLGDGIERRASVPATTAPLDYYSILQDAIKKTEQNSAQLRALVYERARFNFKRDILFGHSSLGLADLVRHVNDFELAVARIEANAVDDQPGQPWRKKETEAAAAFDDVNADSGLTGSESLDSEEPPQSRAVQILPPRPISPMYSGPGQQMHNYAFGRRVEDLLPYRWFANQLLGILLLGIVFFGAAIIAGMLWVSPKTPVRIEAAAPAPKVEEKVVQRVSPAEEIALLKEAAPKVTYPLPSAFGIYVLNENKLAEMQTLPINIPDPRVALSAEIKAPSTMTIAESKPAFILFRRDLLNNAPQKLALRVVARVARDTKIVDGKATVTNIEGSWRIRNIAKDLKVSPVPGQTEMVIARLEDDAPLAPGRYALVINKVGYDFTVDGPVKSAEFCLEGFEASNGSVFTQCKAP